MGRSWSLSRSLWMCPCTPSRCHLGVLRVPRALCACPWRRRRRNDTRASRAPEGHHWSLVSSGTPATALWPRPNVPVAEVKHLLTIQTRAGPAEILGPKSSVFEPFTHTPFYLRLRCWNSLALGIFITLDSNDSPIQEGRSRLRLLKSFAGKYSPCEHKAGAETNSWRHLKELSQHLDQLI